MSQHDLNVKKSHKDTRVLNREKFSKDQVHKCVMESIEEVMERKSHKSRKKNSPNDNDNEALLLISIVQVRWKVTRECVIRNEQSKAERTTHN